MDTHRITGESGEKRAVRTAVVSEVRYLTVLLDFGPFNPTSMIMSKVVNEWEIDAIQLLDDALDRLKEELDDLVNKHFSAFHGGLRAQVW